MEYTRLKSRFVNSGVVIDGEKTQSKRGVLNNGIARASQMVLLVKNPPANAEDVGSTSGLGGSPGGGHGNLIQYSCLENSMDRGAWWATVYGATKSWTQLRIHNGRLAKTVQIGE